MNNFLETNHQPNVDNKNELFQAFKRVYDIINENSRKINTMFDIISVDENPANKCPPQIIIYDEHQVNQLKNDVSALQTEVGNVKGDVSALQTEVRNVKGDVSALQTEVGDVEGDVSALQTEVETIQSDLSILQAITDALKAIILDGASYGKLLVGWGKGEVPHWINIWEEPLNIWTEQRYFWNEIKPTIAKKIFDVETLRLIANEIANSFETAEDSEQKSGVSGLVDMDTFETENCLFNADALGSAFDYTLT
jgi:FtsZ-binding cell division protein ZapB